MRVSFSRLACALLLLADTSSGVEHIPNKNTHRPRIAIIGGGIGGTFAARYLAQYDATSCSIDSITLFDPSPQLSTPNGGKGRPGGPATGGSADELGPNRQGARVSSLTLSDETVVELGASIIFSGNELVSDVVDSDPNLQRAEPLSPGKDKKSRQDAGFGIYDGEGRWPVLIDPNTSSYMLIAKMLYRYGMDLIRVRNAALEAFESFVKIYELLNSTDTETYFDSPDDLWKAVNLYDMSTVSFDDYLDSIGVSGGSPGTSTWWGALYESTAAYFLPLMDWMSNWLLPSRGNLRREICESVNINNYNQDNERLNGLAGLVSFLPTQGSVYSVLGGNAQLLTSSFEQAKSIYAKSCNSSDAVRHRRTSVGRVAFNDGSFDLFTADNKNEHAGTYDLVILAVPIQQCQVDLPPMESAVERRPYTQTITTIISNGTLQSDHFSIANTTMPRAVSITERGKEEEHFSCLAELTDDGTFKVFSSQPLSTDLRQRMFGNFSVVAYQKTWGGEYGGAYPDFNGGKDSLSRSPFLLHGKDGGVPFYYIHTIESAVSAMEVVAIGAKAVSKLVARRLGLI